MLLGEYRLNLDDKGRLSVPSALRHTLRELYAPDDTSLIVTRFFENCLVVYPKVVWLGIQAQLLAMPNDPPSRAFVRQFCASASTCSLDRQGRLLIPPKLRQYADINGDVLVHGVVNKLELWSPSRWEVYEATENDPFETNARVMQLRL